MSYLPSTKLCSGSDMAATVLTDDKVMVTSGIGAGQLMKLDDWLILAENNVTILSSKGKEPVSPSIGSKFRWHLNGGNYRVAIMTTKGVLQVKSVNDGDISTAKTMFSDEEAWRASLPLDKEAITELVGPDTRTMIQKRLEDPLDCRFSHGSDADKLGEYMDRFKIKTKVCDSPSPSLKAKNSLERIQDCRAELNKITLEDELQGSIRHTLSLRLNKALRLYFMNKRLAAVSDDPSKGIMKIVVCGTSRLRALIGGVNYEVGIKSDCIMASQIAIREISKLCKPVRLFNSFKEMGDPKFYVLYRCNRYELPL